MYAVITNTEITSIAIAFVNLLSFLPCRHFFLCIRILVVLSTFNDRPFIFSISTLLHTALPAMRLTHLICTHASLVCRDWYPQLHVIDDAFTKYLENKIDQSKDLEERAALSSLLGTITSVLERVREAESEGSVDEAEQELTVEQVRQRMQVREE